MDDLTEEKLEKLIEVLMLTKNASRDKYPTQWGWKTDIGLKATIKAILNGE